MRTSMNGAIKALMIALVSFTVLAQLPRASYGNTKPGFVINVNRGQDDYTTFTPNNIHTWTFNSGVFDQNPTTNNSPGFQWPAGSGKYAIFTAGLTIMGYVNGELRMAAASYTGEYLPGKVIYNNGIPAAYTDSTFKIYKVSSTDNCTNNPDWANWGLMVPYGAPYVDVNSNSQYDPCIDTPGVKNAKETIFIYMTDAFKSQHSGSEGFSGGTEPLYAEVGFTMWGYNSFGTSDVQFMKWNIINKNTEAWDSLYVALVSDPDIGDATDDYVGIDTSTRLGYAYNSDDQDGTGAGVTYGSNPPAAGFQFLRTPNDLGITSFVPYENTGSGGVTCEQDPENPIEAYYLIRGFKNDGSPWLNPMINPPSPTKYCFDGWPNGWTEFTGVIHNCGGDTTGTTQTSAPGDRRMVISSGSNQFTMIPGDTTQLVASQLIARGSNNLNSVTKLLGYAAFIKELYMSGFVNVGITNISTSTPDGYALEQNYPNPFNPVTNIKFSIPKAGLVTIRVYDITGREVTTLVNNKLAAGTYNLDFDGSKLSSGMYFYSLETTDYRETKKMVLLK